jgi:hypothetical protein
MKICSHILFLVTLCGCSLLKTKPTSNKISLHQVKGICSFGKVNTEFISFVKTDSMNIAPDNFNILVENSINYYFPAPNKGFINNNLFDYGLLDSMKIQSNELKDSANGFIYYCNCTLFISDSNCYNTDFSELPWGRKVNRKFKKKLFKDIFIRAKWQVDSVHLFHRNYIQATDR